MENYMGHTVNEPMNADHIEKMYPETYMRIYPHVQYIVNSLSEESLHNMKNEDVDRLTEEALRRSMLLDDPPMGHSRATIGDMTRGLVVRDLHDRFRRRGGFPFFSPFFFFPFDGFDRFDDRHHRRDFDHDRDRDHERRRY